MAQVVTRKADNYYIPYKFMNAPYYFFFFCEGAFSLPARRAAHSRTIVCYFYLGEKQKETNEPGQSSKQSNSVVTACRELESRCSFVVTISVRNADVFH